MLLTQRNLQRADDKLVGLDILKSEFRVTEEDVMVIKASRSKSTRLIWTIFVHHNQIISQSPKF